jgi:enamine deaminase RidA (YjgF/YER057c/UK114 family)
LKTACDGDLDRVKRVLRLGGFVNCTPDFTEMPQVVNGASDLMAAVFGDAGQHARAAVGVSSLPLGVAVEVEAMFEIA